LAVGDQVEASGFLEGDDVLGRGVEALLVDGLGDGPFGAGIEQVAQELWSGHTPDDAGGKGRQRRGGAGGGAGCRSSRSRRHGLGMSRPTIPNDASGNRRGGVVWWGSVDRGTLSRGTY